MPKLVRMKALRSWINREHEGQVVAGQEFEVLEHRARDLELHQLASRVVAMVPMQTKAEVPPRPLPITPAAGPGEPASSPADQTPEQSTLRLPGQRRKGAAQNRGD
jgi:hypothetical protein